MRYEVIRALVEAQGAVALRANAYMAIDRQREKSDEEYHLKQKGYRDAIRRQGYHLVLKTVRRYRDKEGQMVVKANADLDLAVDALLQADNLDYVLLGSGDGDFIRLVRALQNRGKRVDLLSFENTSDELRREVDYHFRGALLPGLVPTKEEGRHRGVMHSVKADKGFGFLTVQTGLRVGDVRDDVFCHISDLAVDGYSVNNDYFASLKTRRAILEFDLVEQDDGRIKATSVREFYSQR